MFSDFGKKIHLGAAWLRILYMYLVSARRATLLALAVVEDVHTGRALGRERPRAAPQTLIMAAFCDVLTAGEVSVAGTLSTLKGALCNHTYTHHIIAMFSYSYIVCDRELGQ